MIQAHPLVERSKIVSLLLHIKLDIMQQSVKALDKDFECLGYMHQISRINNRKIKSLYF